MAAVPWLERVAFREISAARFYPLWLATIAVVGLSATPGKAAHGVPALLADCGYEVVAVNPNHAEIAGRPSYPSLEAIPDDVTVDLVNVFRPAEEAPAIVRAAVARGVPAVWLQRGITSSHARALAEDAGMDYVEDRCIGVVAREHVCES
jgi:predicted CoA-binding protein